jgi:hypothetical protein
MRFPQRIASAVSLALSASAAHAQQASQTPTQFVVLDYMKIAPGKEAEYVRLEQQVFKPLHQQRVKNKEMVAWGLYQVPFTADTHREYDYVTANVYDNIAATEATGLMATFQRLHPGKEGTSLIAQTGAARTTVRREIWQLIDQTTPLGTADKPAPPAKYLIVSFMLSKANGNYETVEKELWKPIHEDRVKAGAMLNWSLYGLVLPGGTSYPYDYATVNGLSNLTAFTTMYSEELFKRVHPNLSVTDLGNRTSASRDLVRQELWVLVDTTR